MKFRYLCNLLLMASLIFPAGVLAAYHHAGEADSPKFLAVYPDAAGTKIDSCALCHSGGSYINSKGKDQYLGSCQWCHYELGVGGDPQGTVADTLNPYGKAYLDNGRNENAVSTITTQTDSDSDGYGNADEIAAGTFPGDPDDYPGLQPAPSRVYTKAQLKALGAHTEFMLMNATRSDDGYVQYTGVPIETLLNDAGILSSSTEIIAYSPDGFSYTYPLKYTDESNVYHVTGTMPDSDVQYPQGTYWYDPTADLKNGGWCDYSDPFCQGYTNAQPIAVTGGLKAILAYARAGVDLDTGVLDDSNKLDGEGPFRVVVPQKVPSEPDQAVDKIYDTTTWPYQEDGDHNAGACARTVTFIKVLPLPEGTTDVDVYEEGWRYVDEEKIVIYGAIDGGDDGGDADISDDDDDDEDGDGDDGACFIRTIFAE